ncbi:glycosyltransferase family 87 protein [Corynebacterium testudinoris]|uniref:glycosyltransferase family 87 protein n=1 Tax=Corynebacterium testudinoris TaxID=136857 RepID=UPI002892C378|nr:glycosyltransferase family 87 protein [Corynebacterium testudinoris]
MTTAAKEPATLPQSFILKMVTVLGLLAGLGAIGRQIEFTTFPVDMVVYREGVVAFLEGREMYSVRMPAGSTELPFIYPPFGALVLVPLSIPGVFSDDQAGNIMLSVSAVLILVCLFFVLRTVTAGKVDRLSLYALSSVAWAAMMLIEPVYLNSSYAQINVILMALVILDIVPRKRWLPQGTLIGIAAAIKLSPLAMLLYFLLRGKLRPIFVAVASALIATGAAALVRWDATVEFFSSVLLGMGTEAEFGVDSTYQSNSSLKGMIMRWYSSTDSLAAHGTQVNIIWLGLVVLTIGLGGWLMWALIRRGMLIDAALVNAFIMLLVSPVSWSHHWVWLALALPVLGWRCVTTFGVPVGLSALTLVWTWLVLQEPPKWWYGDNYDVHSLTYVEKFLISDFVWLAIATMIAIAVNLRKVPLSSAD